MIEKAVSAGIGMVLLASPLIVSAQAVNASSNTALIAALTQLVQTLEQELQQLLAAQGRSSNTSPGQTTMPVNLTFTATPISGPVPLTVTFSMPVSWATLGGVSITSPSTDANLDTGDGTVYSILDTSYINCVAAGQKSVCKGNHTYTSPGIYTATLRFESGYTLSTQTITVINSGQPSATIDQSSLSQEVVQGGSPTLAGAASNTSAVDIYLNGEDTIYASVTNGRWSTPLPNYLTRQASIQLSISRWS